MSGCGLSASVLILGLAKVESVNPDSDKLSKYCETNVYNSTRIIHVLWEM